MTTLNHYRPIAESISLLFYPFAEVVLHDLKKGTIAGIYNNFSNRKIGDESLLDELKNFDDFPDVFPVYLKTNSDGKKIKSISATLRNQGTPIGLLCINVDVSKWEEIHHFLGSWINCITQPQPNALFKDDWRERINSYVAHYLSQTGTSLKYLSKTDKKKLIFSLYQEGAFKAKNAVNYIAQILDLSRATIYNYLKEKA